MVVDYPVRVSLQASTPATGKIKTAFGQIEGHGKTFRQNFGGILGGVKQDLGSLVTEYRLAAAAIGVSLGAVFASSGQFQQDLGRIGIMMGKPVEELGGVAKTINKMTGDTLQKAGDLSDGFYAVKSAFSELDELGVADVLGPTAKAAKAARSDIEDVVGALSSLMHAYGVEAKDTERVLDRLWATERSGKTTVKELSTSLGDIAKQAQGAGLSMDELLGAVATLSVSFGTASSVTNLAGMLTTLSKPTKEATETARGMGIDLSITGMRKAGGLAPFMEQIGKATGGDTEKLAKLFTDTQGARAAGALSGAQDITRLKDFTKAIEESQGLNAEAYSIATDNLIDSLGGLREQMSRLARALTGPWADALQTIVEGVANIVGKISEFFENNSWAGTAATIGMTYYGGRAVKRRFFGGGGGSGGGIDGGLTVNDLLMLEGARQGPGVLRKLRGVDGKPGLLRRGFDWAKDRLGRSRAPSEVEDLSARMTRELAKDRAEELATRQADDVARMTKRAADNLFRKTAPLEDLGTRMARETAAETGVKTGGRLAETLGRVAPRAAGTVGKFATHALPVVGTVLDLREAGLLIAEQYENIAVGAASKPGTQADIQRAFLNLEKYTKSIRSEDPETMRRGARNLMADPYAILAHRFKTGQGIKGMPTSLKDWMQTDFGELQDLMTKMEGHEAFQRQRKRDAFQYDLSRAQQGRLPMWAVRDAHPEAFKAMQEEIAKRQAEVGTIGMATGAGGVTVSEKVAEGEGGSTHTLTVQLPEGVALKTDIRAELERYINNSVARGDMHGTVFAGGAAA